MFWKVIVSIVFLVVLTPDVALAVQYPPESTTPSTILPTSTVPPRLVSVTTAKPQLNPLQPNKKVAASGVLVKTGAGNLTAPVRIGVVLMVAGFVCYLVGRNRRAVKANL